jgi:hypothetical protein
MNTSATICTENITSLYGNTNTIKKKPEIPTEASKDVYLEINTNI